MNQVKERGIDDGHIFFVNRFASIIHVVLLCLVCSIFGHKVPPGKYEHFYSATKFAVTALVEGVRQELRELKSNCRVTVSILNDMHVGIC